MDNGTDNSYLEEMKDLFITNVQNINVSDLNENLVQKVLNNALNYIEKTLNQVTVSINAGHNITKSVLIEKLSNHFQDCNCVLDSLISFFKHLDNFNHVELSSYKNLPVNVIQILFLFFDHCKKSEKIYSEKFDEVAPIVTEVFKKCLELEILYLNIFTNRLTINLNNDEELNILFKVINVLADINEIVIDLDIKTMAEGWKGYLKICEKYHFVIKEKMIHSKATVVLCDKIVKNLLSFLSHDTSNVIQNRSLKMNDFLIKVLIKLTDIYSGHLADNLDHIISCFVFIYQNSPTYLQYSGMKPNLIENLKTNITIGTEMLLVNLLKDQNFKSSYFNQIKQLRKDDSLKFGCISLTLSIIKFLVEQDEYVKYEWCNYDEHNIVCVLIDTLPICKAELLKNILFISPFETDLSVYDFALIYTSRLVVSCKEICVIEKKIVQTLLKPCLLSAMFTCDLWLIISRFSSSEYRIQQLEYLIDMYFALDTVHSFKNSPQEACVSYMLHELFKRLSNANKMKILNDYPIFNHPSLWEKLGIHNLPEDVLINESLIVKKHSIMAIKDFLTFDNNSMTKFMKMVECFKLLTLVPFSEHRSSINTEEISNLIIDLWNCLISFNEFDKIQKSSKLITQRYCEFFLLLLDVTSNIGFGLSQENWINVLSNLSLQINTLPPMVKLGVLQMVETYVVYRVCENQDVSKSVSLIISFCQNIYKDVDPIICLLTIETIISFSSTAENLKIVSDIMNVFRLTLRDFFKFKGDSVSENLYLYHLDSEFKHKCASENNVLNSLCSIEVSERNTDSVSSCLEIIENTVDVLKKESLNIDDLDKLKGIRDSIDDIILENSL